MSLPFLQSRHEDISYTETSPASARMNTVFRAIINGEQAVGLLRAASIQATNRKPEGEQRYGQFMQPGKQPDDRLNFRTKYSNFIADKAAKEFIDPPVPVVEPEYATVAPGTPSILEEEPFDPHLFDAVVEEMKTDSADKTAASTPVKPMTPQEELIEKARQAAGIQSISAKDAYGHIAQVTHNN